MAREFGCGNISVENVKGIYNAVQIDVKAGKVAKYYSVHRSTVYAILKRVKAKNNGEIVPKPRGRPPKLSELDLKRLELCVMNNRFKPAHMIANIFNEGGSLSISTRRLGRYIHKLAFQNRKAVHKPYMRPHNILKRIAFAQYYWKISILDRVCFQLLNRDE